MNDLIDITGLSKAAVLAKEEGYSNYESFLLDNVCGILKASPIKADRG